MKYSLKQKALLIFVLAVFATSIFYLINLFNQRRVLGVSNSVTVISVSDDKIQNNVKRLGLNLGNRSRYSISAHLLKNLIDNPGFEGSEMGTVALSGDRSESGTTDIFRQYCWNVAWNNEQAGVGQPEDFWNGAEYEIISGPAKGKKGTVEDFYFSPDDGGVSRFTFKLDQPVPVPEQYNAMLVRKEFDFAEIIPWRFINEVLVERAEKRPNSPGEQSIKIGQDGIVEYFMDTAWRDSDRTIGKGLVIKGNWRLAFWAKSEKAGNRLNITFGRSNLNCGFFEKTVTFADDDWHYYEYNFPITCADDINILGVISLKMMEPWTFINDGFVWLDDVYLASTDDTNPTAFTDVAVNRLKELRPGVLRNFSDQLGASLKNQTDSAFAKGANGFFLGSREPKSVGYSIHDFLTLSKEIGADPWYNIPPSWSAEELRDFIDYLAGPTNTVYGAKRAALGQSAPWTNVFTNIYLEFANEAWGGGCGSDPFRGASFNGGIRVAAVASDRFGIMKANPNFNAKIKFIIGGLFNWPITQRNIEQTSVNHNLVALAPYFYGDEFVSGAWNNNEEIFGPLYATAIDRSINNGKIIKSKQYLDAENKGTEMALYEINFHTTAKGDLSDELRNKVVTSIGGGIALPLHMLTYLKNFGVKVQNAFTFLQYSVAYDTNKYVRLWGALRDLETVGSKRPTWLGIEIANKAIFGDLITANQSGSNPKWEQPAINGIASPLTVPYINSFAFKDGNKYSLIIFNLNRTNNLTTKIDLPHIPKSNAILYTLTSNNIYDNNENSEAVRINAANLSNFSNNYELDLHPFSINVIVWEKDRDTPPVKPPVASESADPIVITGANLPATANFSNLAPNKLAAFRYQNSWQQIPVQVDEKDIVAYDKIYHSVSNYGEGFSKLVYTDENTFTGSDSNLLIDANDEIVFMAKDVGLRAGNIAAPSGVAGGAVEIEITDQAAANKSYIYLFEHNGSLNPSAGRDYVNYQFNLLSGAYLTRYQIVSGPNPENSTVTTAYYQRHFSDRWIDDELKLLGGASTKVDILDRHKSLFAPANCSRSEKTFSEGEGAFITNKDGPVRAIRSYLGANSGVITQRDHFYYEKREDIVNYLRVHGISGIMDFFDYSPAASGLTYYDNNNLSGVIVDGNNDGMIAGRLEWQMLTGNQGSVALVNLLNTNISGLNPTSYYLDSANPGTIQCTGDAQAYGSSGFWVNQSLPNTDPLNGTAKDFVLSTYLYFGTPGLTVADAQNYNSRIKNNPFSTVARQWTPSAGCTPSWSCTAWSACSGNQQTRVCTDSNNCGTDSGKPAETQSCTQPTCTPNWSCGNWSACHLTGYQVRTCNDSNACGTMANKPEESRTCQYIQPVDGQDGNQDGSQDDGTTESAPINPTYYKGQLVKLANDSAVYQVDSENQRHLFVNEVTYWTWYTGQWSDQNIKIISQTEFNLLALGKNVTARPGVNLIRFKNSPKVYAVRPGAKLCQTVALYGANWQQRVIIIQTGFENDYQRDPTCEVRTRYPDGALIQYKDSTDIWYLEDNHKRLVKPTVLEANKFPNWIIMKEIDPNMNYETGWDLEVW